MRECIKCGTNQIQRRRDGDWRTLCKCRHCGFKIYDSLSYREYQEKVDSRNFVKDLMSCALWHETQAVLEKEDMLYQGEETGLGQECKEKMLKHLRFAEVINKACLAI